MERFKGMRYHHQLFTEYVSCTTVQFVFSRFPLKDELNCCYWLFNLFPWYPVNFSVAAVYDLVVTSEPWADISQDTTLTCSSSSEQFLEVLWRRSPLNDTYTTSVSFLRYQSSPSSISWNVSIDQTHFIFDATMDNFPFTVKSVTLDDEGTYWCLALGGTSFWYSYQGTDVRVRGKIEVRYTVRSKLVTVQPCLPFFRRPLLKYLRLV